MCEGGGGTGGGACRPVIGGTCTLTVDSSTNVYCGTTLDGIGWPPMVFVPVCAAAAAVCLFLFHVDTASKPPSSNPPHAQFGIGPVFAVRKLLLGSSAIRWFQ